MASYEGGGGASIYCRGARELVGVMAALEMVALEQCDEAPLHGAMVTRCLLLSILNSGHSF